MAEIDAATVPPDTLLAAELTDNIILEMANLTAAQTGIDGTIFVATAIGAHCPRVKHFLQPGRTEPSFSVSVSDKPVVLANSLPARVVRRMAPRVVEWLSLNKDGVLDFWDRGDTWTQPQVHDFIQQLRPVRPDRRAGSEDST